MTGVANHEFFNGVGVWRLPSVTSDDWYSSLEEDPVAHIVVLPNYKEDEAMFREARKILAALLRERNTSVCEGPNTQEKLSISWPQLAATARTLFSTDFHLALRAVPPSAGIHVRMVFTMETRAGLDTEYQAGRLTAVSGHLFKDMMATHHHPGVAGEVPDTSSNIKWAFRQVLDNMVSGATLAVCSRRAKMLIHPGIHTPSVRSYRVPGYH